MYFNFPHVLVLFGVTGVLLLLVLLLLLLQLFEHVLFVALLCRLFKCGPLDIEIFLALAGVRILGRHVCLCVCVWAHGGWMMTLKIQLPLPLFSSSYPPFVQFNNFFSPCIDNDVQSFLVSAS